MKLGKEIFFAVSLISVVSAIMMVILLTYWYVYPYKPITLKNNVFAVSKDVVRGGEVLEYIMSYCKHTDTPVLISRRFVDGIVYSLPDITASNQRGCRDMVVGLEIPKSLPPGRYKVEINYSYEVNPIREVSVGAQTEEFSVIN